MNHFLRCLSPAFLAVGVLVSATSVACGKSQEALPTSAPTSVGPVINAVAASGTAMVHQAAARGPEHSVYSLEDNRLTAHLLRAGGMKVVGPSAGFAKYLRYSKTNIPWTREKVEGVDAATLQGNVGRIFVPMLKGQVGGSSTLRMRVHSASERRLSIRVNGEKKREASVELGAGWQTIETTLANGLLRAGENEILFFFSKGPPVSMRWIQVGGGSSTDDDLAIYNAKTGLVLPEGGGFAYYLLLPQKSLVTGDLTDPKCKVAVTAQPQAGQAVAGELVGKGSAVDLRSLAGKVVRLELRATGCREAHLAKAAISVPGAAPSFARNNKKPKYVVFWIMDSLRADRVKTFVSSARPEVPAFDELAKSSAVFAHAYVQGNESKSSHASIWTSMYPVVHRFFNDRDKLKPAWNILPEAMKSAGLFTSGVSGNGYIIERRGFGSWNKFRNHIHVGGGLLGQDILDKGLESIEGKKEPWFLYMGTIDTHVSWRAKEPWISRYDTTPYKGRFVKAATGGDIGKVAGGKLKISERDIQRIIAIYDSNVSYQDKLLADMMESFKKAGIADDLMVIVTADHGDEQWEVGRVGHGGSLRESLVHVPLLIHYPPLFPAGKVVQGVELIDIVPTLADALGMKPDPQWQGQSLIPLANGVGHEYPHLILASQYENAHAASIGAWKLRVAGSGSPNLYNLAKHPDEKTDVADKEPMALRMISDALWMLRAHNAEWKKRHWGNAANVTPAFAADLGE